MASLNLAPVKPETPRIVEYEVKDKTVTLQAVMAGAGPTMHATEVFRGATGNFALARKIGEIQPGQSLYTDLGVTPATNYAYWFRAVTSNGVQGDLSDSELVTTLEDAGIPNGSVTVAKVGSDLARNIRNGGSSWFFEGGVAAPAAPTNRRTRKTSSTSTTYPEDTGPWGFAAGSTTLSVWGQWVNLCSLPVRSSSAIGLNVRAGVQTSYTVPGAPWDGQVRHQFRVILRKRNQTDIVYQRAMQTLDLKGYAVWVGVPDAYFESCVSRAPEGSQPAAGWWIEAGTDYELVQQAMQTRSASQSANMTVNGYSLDFDFSPPGDGLIA